MKVMLASLFVCAFACFAPAAESERQVGLFYFLWLGEHGRKGPWDVSKILAADPDAGQKLDGPIRRRVVLPLYYAGLSGKAEIAVGDDAAFVPVALDARCRAEVEVSIPANGNSSR